MKNKLILDKLFDKPFDKSKHPICKVGNVITTLLRRYNDVITTLLRHYYDVITTLLHIKQLITNSIKIEFKRN